MKPIARFLAGLAVAVALAVLLGALLPWPFSASPATPEGGQGSRHRILVLRNAIHSDIAIPLDDASRQRFAFLSAAGVPVDAPGVVYAIFGWGGRSFYLETPTWGDLKPMPVFRALTLDSSVMHVDVSAAIADPHPSVRGFDLDDAQFAAMLGFIQASFADAAPDAIAGAGYGDHDAFFDAKGKFNAIAGCNMWTAAALRTAGIRTGLWNPLPVSLYVSLDLYNDPSSGASQP